MHRSSGALKLPLLMKGCLSFTDILDVGRPQIAETQRVGDAFPGPDTPGAREAFTRQVRLLEGIVIHTYGVAATLTRKADGLPEVAETWQSMSRFCQEALQVLTRLKHKYSYCGTPELYDLVLDYKLASDRRHKGALEEIECQKMELPKGLLPDLN